MAFPLEMTDLASGVGRRRSRRINVGRVPVGDGAPISVQSMTITKTADINGTLQQIAELAAIPEAGKLFWDTTVATVKGLGGFVTGLADRISAPEQAPAGSGGGGGGEVRDGGPIGIVGITRLAGQAVANNQWAIFIAILIQLNIVVGVFNLLPLPPMDGGYLAFVLWQVVTRREVDLRKVVPVAALIVGLLVMLTVGLVWLDITNPVPYPFR